MSMEQITTFFGWMAVLNLGLLILSSVLVMVLRKPICRMQGKMFGIKEETLSVVLYSWLGMYKIIVIVFCLMPYIALALMS